MRDPRQSERTAQRRESLYLFKKKKKKQENSYCGQLNGIFKKDATSRIWLTLFIIYWFIAYRLAQDVYFIMVLGF